MKKKKHPLTLLEIMIVILLIGLIGSVVGVNMKGSMDKGRVFKTQQAMEQVHDILMLEVAQGSNIDEVANNPLKFLENSGLAKNPEKLLNDGWNIPFDIVANNSKTDIKISSEKYKAYEAAHEEKTGKKSKSK